MEEVISNLRHSDHVVGLLQIGSLSNDSLTPASDYDLIIILRKTKKPWFVGVTYISDRFTDLIFVAKSEIDSSELP